MDSGEKVVKVDLNAILASLEDSSDNDNRKFAILLILSELIKSKKLENDLKSNEQLNERLFKSIDPHFLARLLSTKQAPPSDACSPLIYKSVSLSILTQFLDYPNLLQDPLLITKLDCFFDIIKADCDTDDQEQRTLETNLKLDTFKVLYRLSKTDAAEYLVSNGLVDVLFERVILNEKLNAHFKLITDFNANSELANLSLIACKLIANLFECPMAMTTGVLATKFDAYFKRLLGLCQSDKSEFKFCLINFLNYFLQSDSSVRGYLEKNSALSEFTSGRVYAILNDLFKNRLNQSANQLAFYLLKNFVGLYQFEFIYLKDRSFFYLLIHLLCLQINVNLQMYDGDRDLPLNMDAISIYFSLLEEIIIILSTASPFDDADEDDEENDSETDCDIDDDDDDDEDFDFHEDKGSKPSNKGEKKKTAPTSSNSCNEPELDKVIQVVVELLQTVIQFVKDLLASTSSSSSSSDFSQLNSNETILAVNSTRLLMCWLSHESLLEKEICELVPKLMPFAEYVLNSNGVNLYKFMAAGLQKIVVNLNEKFGAKLKKSASFMDNNAKYEFEKHELNEQIDTVKSLLDKCYINIKD